MNPYLAYLFNCGTALFAMLCLGARAASHNYQLSDGTQVAFDCQPTRAVLTLAGQPNSTYTIAASENLVDWVTVAQANLGPSGTFNYVDTRGFSKCFYRVAGHGSVLQNNQTSGGGNKMDIKLGQKGAQSFRHGIVGGPGYYLSKVVLHVSRESQAPNASLNVSVGGAVNANPLPGSTVSIPAGQITNATAGVTFMTLPVIFPTPVGPLAAGTTYYLNLECEASNSKVIYVEYAGGNVYPSGAFYKNGADDGKDMWFELWGF